MYSYKFELFFIFHAWIVMALFYYFLLTAINTIFQKKKYVPQVLKKVCPVEPFVLKV